MKEFHWLLDNAYSKSQLIRYMHDSYWELLARKVTTYECGHFFNRAYGMDWTTEQKIAFGAFVKSGQYKDHVELYK